MGFGRSWGQRARGVRGGLRQLWGADGHSEEPAGCQGVACRRLAGVGGGAQGGNSTTLVGPPRPSPRPPWSCVTRPAIYGVRPDADTAAGGPRGPPGASATRLPRVPQTRLHGLDS